MAKILNTIGGDQPAYTVTERLNQFQDFLNDNAAATEEYIKTHAIQGERGEQGAQGERGEQGAQGERGEQGAQGERGNGIVSIHTLSHYTDGDEEITTVEVVTDEQPNQQFEVHAYNGVRGDKGLTALEVAPMSYAGVPSIGAVIGVSGTMNRTPVAEDVATFILYDTVGNASYWCTVQFKNVAAEPYPLAAVLSIQAATASGGGGSGVKKYIHNLRNASLIGSRPAPFVMSVIATRKEKFATFGQVADLVEELNIPVVGKAFLAGGGSKDLLWADVSGGIINIWSQGDAAPVAEISFDEDSNNACIDDVIEL